MKCLHWLDPSSAWAGPDPVGAVKNIQRLGLFPVIFSAPSKQAESLGPSVGGPCCQVMAAAADVLQAWETAVSHPCPASVYCSRCDVAPEGRPIQALAHVGTLGIGGEAAYPAGGTAAAAVSLHCADSQGEGSAPDRPHHTGVHQVEEKGCRGRGSPACRCTWPAASSPVLAGTPWVPQSYPEPLLPLCSGRGRLQCGSA